MRTKTLIPIFLLTAIVLMTATGCCGLLREVKTFPQSTQVVAAVTTAPEATVAPADNPADEPTEEPATDKPTAIAAAPEATKAPAAPAPISIPGGTAPGAITSPGPTTANTQVTLSWNSIAGATYYDLGVRNMNTKKLVVDTKVKSGHTYTVTLEAGTAYRWNVAAGNSGGLSEYSAVLYFQTPGTAPAAPTTAPGSGNVPPGYGGSNSVKFGTDELRRVTINTGSTSVIFTIDRGSPLAADMTKDKADWDKSGNMWILYHSDGAGNKYEPIATVAWVEVGKVEIRSQYSVQAGDNEKPPRENEFPAIAGSSGFTETLMAGDRVMVGEAPTEIYFVFDSFQPFVVVGPAEIKVAESVVKNMPTFTVTTSLGYSWTVTVDPNGRGTITSPQAFIVYSSQR